MRIDAVESHVLLAPNYDPRFTSSAQDSFVVVLRTDEGVEGIGESDVNPWIAKACLEAPGTHTMGLCMKELLLGADPSDIDGIWRRTYLGTAMNGRRGAVVHALGAVEMALWDLKRQGAGQAGARTPGRGGARHHRALRLAPAGGAQLRRVPRRAGRVRGARPRRWASRRSSPR